MFLNVVSNRLEPQSHGNQNIKEFLYTVNYEREKIEEKTSDSFNEAFQIFIDMN